MNWNACPAQSIPDMSAPNTSQRLREPSAKSPLRIALVEDKPEVRESWRRLITSFPDFSCVLTCSTGEEALKMIPPIQAEVVLMDIYLPRMSGIECTSRLKELLPQTRIVMLTAVDDDELIFMALEAGADGYLLKRTKPADLHAALLDVLGGGAPMTSEIARRVVESFRRKARDRENTVGLTRREEEILVLLTKGYSNKEIADRLELGVETVRSHLKHIYEKMHVRSRTEAVARYMTARNADADEPGLGSG
jgi:DNA-binding NarL/FixJ family response regulator